MYSSVAEGVCKASVLLVCLSLDFVVGFGSMVPNLSF